MSNHLPLIPAEAIKLVEAKGVQAAESLLADFAAAGLIRTYALVREIRHKDGPCETVRDSKITTEEWGRIIADGKTSAALRIATVRLDGSDMKGGMPAVHITGISFSKTSLLKVLDRYCTQSGARTESGPTATGPAQAERKKPSTVAPIKDEDLTASVEQVMRATGLGRTKINDLMRTGQLERTKVGRRTLITVASLRRLLGGVDKFHADLIV